MSTNNTFHKIVSRAGTLVFKSNYRHSSSSSNVVARRSLERVVSSRKNSNNNRFCLTISRASTSSTSNNNNGPGSSSDDGVTSNKKNITVAAVVNDDLGNDDDDDGLSDWIPPDRPLSGDKGQAHLFIQPEDDDGDDEEEVEMSRLQQELNQLEREEEEEERAELRQFEEELKQFELEEQEQEQVLEEIDDNEEYETETDDEDEDIDEEEEIRRIEEELEQFELEEEKLEQEKIASASSSTQAQDDSTSIMEGNTLMDEAGVDWMRTRRSVLGDDIVDADENNDDKYNEAFTKSSSSSKGGDAILLKPSQGRTKRRAAADLPVIMHTLLTEEEITSCVSSMGGNNITVIHAKDKNVPNMGPGTIGMFFVSAPSCVQIRIIANNLVRQLKRRKLQERGVVGAKYGVEGSDDKDETWLVVDCDNYTVHILDEGTRNALKLEDLWTGKDKIFQILNDPNATEDMFDDYVAANPVPGEYFDGVVNRAQHDFNQTIAMLEKNRWLAPHRPVVTDRPRMKRKKRSRKKRRN